MVDPVEGIGACSSLQQDVKHAKVREDLQGAWLDSLATRALKIMLDLVNELKGDAMTSQDNGQSKTAGTSA